MDTLDKSKQSSSVISATVQFEGNDKNLVGMICGLLGFWLFAQSMLNVNLVMGKSLHLDSSTLNFAVSIMAMVCGMFIVVIGRLGDILGHTRVLRIGYYLSIVGSIIIAVVPLSGIFLLRDLPQDPKPASNTPSKFDYLGSFILVLMLVSLMIIIINGGAWGWLWILRKIT